MILFKTILSFRQRMDALLKVRRNVYQGVSEEIVREFEDQDINRIRQNRDMILLEGDLVVIKLRLPDKRQRLSRKDGYRLIYLVSKVDEIVVFLDIYPKNGPSQQLNITAEEIKRLLVECIELGKNGLLDDFRSLCLLK